MSFGDFPFTPAAMAAAGVPSADARRFPGHGEVLRYLRAYAAAHSLRRHVRFGARVARAAPVWPSAAAAAAARGADGGSQAAALWPRWELTVEQEEEVGPSGGANGSGSSRSYTEAFDALVVCNGHYSATNLPEVAGAGAFPGRLLHSHNYRAPDDFAGQRVVVVGASNSGEDLCREIASTAERVWIAARSWKNAAWASDGGGAPFGPRANIERRGMVARLLADGTAEFEGGGARAERVDAVVFATGYRYDFPFLRGTVLPSLEAEAAAAAAAAAVDGGGGDDCDCDALAAGALSTVGQRVAPLYRHAFYPPLAPSLSFIGVRGKEETIKRCIQKIGSGDTHVRGVRKTSPIQQHRSNNATASPFQPPPTTTPTTTTNSCRGRSSPSRSLSCRRASSRARCPAPSRCRPRRRCAPTPRRSTAG